MSLLDRFRKNKNQLTREDSLNAIPVRNESVEVEEDDDLAETLILIPRRDDWWVRMLSKVLFIPKHRKVTLDEIGTFVWNLCDGKNDVRKIIEDFADKYKLGRKEAELSMVTFLRQMAKKRLIGLAIGQPEPKEKSKSRRRRRSRGKKKGKKVRH